MRNTLFLPLLVLAAGVAAVAGTTLAQNGGPPPIGGEGSLGSEECAENTSDALARLQELTAEGEDVADAIAAVENCGLGEDGQAQNGTDNVDGDDADGEDGDGDDGNGDGVGISQAGEGHETCSEATQHALEVLQDLLAAGKPVEEAIASVESCGTGAGETNVPDNGGPPAGVPLGAPEGVPPEDVPQGPPEGVPPVDLPLAPPEDIPPEAPPEGLPPLDVPPDAPEGVPPVDVPEGPPIEVPPV